MKAWVKWGLAVLVVAVLVISSFLAYNYYLKYKDQKIISENTVNASYYKFLNKTYYQWNSPTLEDCKSLSKFSGNEKYSCYVRVSQIAPTEEVCEKLENQSKESCYLKLSFIAPTIKVCGIIPSYYQDGCFLLLANQTLRISNQTSYSEVCARVGDYTRRGLCYIDWVLYSKNLTACDTFGPSFCNNTEGEDKTFCENFGWRDYCYWEFAIATTDYFVCRQLNEMDNVYRCREDVKLFDLDSSKCRDNLYKGSAEDCLAYKEAIASQNESLCANVRGTFRFKPEAKIYNWEISSGDCENIVERILTEHLYLAR